MGILLAFAPFLVFAILERFLGSTAGLIAGAILAATMLARDLLTPGRSPKILEIGTTLLFGGLALYAVLGNAGWSVIGVRLCVDAGLLMIVLISILAKHPFTLPYARDRVAPSVRDSPEFLRVNYIIAGVWALAFAVMVIAESALLYVPRMPQRAGVIAIIFASISALIFSVWYPKHQRRARKSCRPFSNRGS
jgi:hypothetical protein